AVAAVWRCGAELDGDASLHGGGETTAEFDRRGSLFVSDQPRSRALPLIWSTKGWGLYFNTLARVEHDLEQSEAGLYQAILHDAVFDLFVFVGEPAEILNQYTALTGRAGQPGVWPMGVWLDQAPGQPVDETLAIVSEFRDNQWGLDAVNLSAPAPFGFQPDKPVFAWDAARIADARDVLARGQALNVQFAAPTFPGVLRGTELFAEWEDRGWLLIDDDGNAYAFPGNDV